MSELYDELKSRLTFRENPNWETYDKVEQVLVVLSQTTSASLIIYRKVRGNPAGQAELSAAIKRLHDEVIAPIDLPGVGPMIEALIDGQLGAILGGVVAPIDAYLDSKIPNPAK